MWKEEVNEFDGDNDDIIISIELVTSRSDVIIVVMVDRNDRVEITLRCQMMMIQMNQNLLQE